MKHFLIVVSLLFCSAAYSQAPVYDDLVFDEEEIGAAYRLPARTTSF